MLDWGEPDERDAGNRLEDYVDDYIPAAIDRILEISGADEVNLFGYCFGGNLTLLYAAHHPDAPLRSLTVLATPVDFRHMGPLADIFRVGGMTVDSVLGSDGNVPPSVVVQGFRTLTPTAEVTRYVNLWERLWNDEYVASYQAMTGWSDDHVPFPGAAARETAQMLVHENGMVTDRLTVGGDVVHLQRHHRAVPDRAGEPRPHRAAGRDRAADRPGRFGGQARAAPRRRPHGAGRRAHRGEDDGADDHRFHPPPQRRPRGCRRPPRAREPEMSVVELGPEHCDALLRFFSELPEGDLTFIEEEVTDPETVRSWTTGDGAGGRWVAVDDDGEVTGYVAVRPAAGLVGPRRRGAAGGLPARRGQRARPRAGAAGAGGGGRRRACRSSSSRSSPSRARRWRCSPTWASAARPCSPTTSATAAGSCAT